MEKQHSGPTGIISFKRQSKTQTTCMFGIRFKGFFFSVANFYLYSTSIKNQKKLILITKSWLQLNNTVKKQ